MIFYLAICDILSLINAPLYIVQFQHIWSDNGAPDFLCKYHYFNLNSVSMASYFFCAFTAIERYFKVVQSKDMLSLRQARFLWFPVLIVSVSIGVVVIFAVENNKNGNCMYAMDARHLATIEYFLMLGVAAIATLVMLIFYIRTGFYLMSKMKELANSSTSFSKSYKTTVQTTKMLAILTSVFLFSANTPYIVGVYISIHKPTTEPTMSVMLALGLTFFINNFFNPFLYMGMSASFRERSKALFQSCCGSTYDPSGKKTGAGAPDA